jgi:hypothetical protein
LNFVAEATCQDLSASAVMELLTRYSLKR